MNNAILARVDARYMGISAAVLAATLAALLAIFVLAKPSEAQATTVTVNPTNVGFGAVVVSADPETRTITIRNTGTTDLVIGGVDILGTNAGDFSLATTIDPLTGLTVRAGEVATLDVNFDPLTEGVKNATLTLNGLLGNAIPGAPQVSLSGTGVTAQASGAPADCTIFGTNRGEILTGTPRNDVICALGGNDNVNGLGGNDILRGGAGKDKLLDKSGKDKAYGESGKDRINVKDRQGGDVANGGPQRDKIKKDKKDKGKLDKRRRR